MGFSELHYNLITTCEYFLLNVAVGVVDDDDVFLKKEKKKKKTFLQTLSTVGLKSERILTPKYTSEDTF